MEREEQKSERGTRRGLLKAAVGLGVGLPAAHALAQRQCRPTAPQTKGPFYPIDTTLGRDTDLTYVDGKPGRALGQVVYVRGQVLDAGCAPIAGAGVEIWQACASGKYDHPSDATNPAPLDPNFQYWGRAITDAQGRYLFKTVIPGSYPAAPGWIRPPHIHFKVFKLGFHELITQMYFAGQRLNRPDRILQSLPAIDQRSVVVPFRPATDAGYDPRAFVGDFTISLRRV